MIEILYDVIRAVAGQKIEITISITEVDEPITENCFITIYSDEEEIITVPGEYLTELKMWQFTIPAEATQGLSGRYWYDVRHNDSNLCFKQPLYLKA